MSPVSNDPADKRWHGLKGWAGQPSHFLPSGPLHACLDINSLKCSLKCQYPKMKTKSMENIEDVDELKMKK